VRVSTSGHIWVAYFDEGVYGNRDWGDPGPCPIGASGLVRFTSDLEPDWHYPDQADHPWGAISDCYALNLDGDTAWACYSTDFPVVRIQDGTVTGWHNTIFYGSRALAVADTTVALYGGNGPNHDVLVSPPKTTTTSTSSPSTASSCPTAHHYPPPPGPSAGEPTST
jgi:hypothetical protein